MSEGGAAGPLDDAEPVAVLGRTGRTDILSLAGIYAFSQAELLAAPRGSHPHRIWLHEHTHVYQSMATSHGYVTTMLRLIQNSCVVRIVKRLGLAGRSLAPSLQAQVRRLPPGIRHEAQEDVDEWVLAALMLRHLEGDVAGFVRLWEIPRFAKRSMPSLFLECERMLSAQFHADGHQLDGAWTGRAPADDRAEEQQTLSMRASMSTGVADVSTVAESGARAAEYWGAWPETFDAMWAAIEGKPVYSFWLSFAGPHVSAPDPRSFLLTYSALVDLALNPPVLPHHAPLRRPETSMGDLNPFRRLVTAVLAVGGAGIPPIRDLHSDYVPFMEAICRTLGWPTPMELSGVGVERLPHPLNMPDPMTANYALSCLLRLSDPTTFLDLDVWTRDSDAARAFCGRFNHPVVQFTDDTWMFDRPEDSITFVAQHVMHQYFSRLMTSDLRELPPIELPFRVSDQQLAFYTKRIEQTIRRRTGLAQPRLRLIGGSPSPHRA